jgi:hypothetical protein
VAIALAHLDELFELMLCQVSPARHSSAGAVSNGIFSGGGYRRGKMGSKSTVRQCLVKFGSRCFPVALTGSK